MAVRPGLKLRVRGMERQGYVGAVGTWYEVLRAVYSVVVLTGVRPYNTAGNGCSLGQGEVRSWL